MPFYSRFIHPLLAFTGLTFTALTLGFLSFFSPVTLAQTATSSQETAAQPLTGNKVHFSISESQEIENDLSTITFSASVQAHSAAAVTNEINLKMQNAIDSLKPFPQIRTKTSQYHIHPAYNEKRVISHWNGSQSLTITLDLNSEQLKSLVSLQEHLTYQSMQFSVSADRKQKIIDQLTIKAIQAFQDQAKLIAKNFDAKSYQILETRINTPQSPAFRQNYISSRMVMAESMAAPVIEGGQSNVKVEISGIMLLPY